MIALILKIVALILFIFATFGIPLLGINLIPLGLACWVGSGLTRGR